MKPKKILPLFIIFLFFACNNNKADNKENVLQLSTSTPSSSELIEKKQRKSLFDLINSKKEKASDLPKDLDFSKNYTKKELQALNLHPEKIKSNEYYLLSEQKFLKDEIKGLSFQIYYKQFYGSQLEKILRVQKADTIFDIILAGTYSNGLDGSMLSTKFINNTTFKESLANIHTIKDEPHITAYNIDSLFTFYQYNNKFDFIKNQEYIFRWYKEISENPVTKKNKNCIRANEIFGKNTEYRIS